MRTRATVASAFAGFIALGVFIIGQFWQAATSNVVGPTPPDLGARFASLYAECEVEDLVLQNEFADYGSWSEFSQACCCADRQSEASFGEEFTPGEVELWHCANGLYKERVRIGGLPIRGFCATSFAGGSEPFYDPASKRVVVEVGGQLKAGNW